MNCRVCNYPVTVKSYLEGRLDDECFDHYTCQYCGYTEYMDEDSWECLENAKKWRKNKGRKR